MAFSLIAGWFDNWRSFGLGICVYWRGTSEEGRALLGLQVVDARHGTQFKLDFLWLRFF